MEKSILVPKWLLGTLIMLPLLILQNLGYTQTPTEGVFDAYESIENALASQEITHIFFTLTLALYFLTILLHVARPYMVRMLQSFSLRFSVDIWWIGYLTFRDLSLYACFVLGLFLFIPYFKIGYPEISDWPYILAIVMLAGTIGLRIFADTEKQRRFVWISNGLLLLGLPFICYSYYTLTLAGGGS